MGALGASGSGQVWGLAKIDEEWSRALEVAQLSVADTSPEKEQCKSEQQRPRAQ